jgi:hypothetical protein
MTEGVDGKLEGKEEGEGIVHLGAGRRQMISGVLRRVRTKWIVVIQVKEAWGICGCCYLLGECPRYRRILPISLVPARNCAPVRSQRCRCLACPAKSRAAVRHV